MYDPAKFHDISIIFEDVMRGRCFVPPDYYSSKKPRLDKVNNKLDWKGRQQLGFIIDHFHRIRNIAKIVVCAERSVAKKRNIVGFCNIADLCNFWNWERRRHRKGSPMHERQTYFLLFSLTFGFYINPFWPSCRKALSPSFNLLSFYLKASSRNNKSLKRALFGTRPRTRNQCAKDLSKEKIRAPLAGNTMRSANLHSSHINDLAGH